MESSSLISREVVQARSVDLRVVCLDSHASTTSIPSLLLRKIIKCEVSVANDGVSGLELVKAMKPDVVFCCIELPGRDGYEVAKEIRKSMPQNPLLVAHTSYSKREVGERAKVAGFNYLLTKPAKVDEIARILSCVDGSLIDAELKL